MWTSLFPLAWSARSPCRLLTSMEAGSARVPVEEARISPRFRRSSSFSLVFRASSKPRYVMSQMGLLVPLQPTILSNRGRDPRPPPFRRALRVAANQVADAAKQAPGVAFDVLAVSAVRGVDAVGQS